MRYYRLLVVILLLSIAFSVGNVWAQEEATEEAEATVVVDEEVTAEPEATEAPEVTETSDAETTSEPEVEDGDSEEDATSNTYIVRPGDNLFRIALRFGLTTNQLAQANNIANPSLIFVGQVLTIPGSAQPETPTPTPTPDPEATETPEAPEEEPDDTSVTSYVVQPGDTLFRIAVRNNTTVATLLSLNTIPNPNLIFVGQRINLPGAEDSPPADDTDDQTDDTEEEAEAGLDVVMMTGIEVFQGDDYAANASLSTQLNVSWVKLTVDWSVVEPEEGTFNFDELDQAVETFADNFDILLLLTGAPDWARPSATDLAREQPTYGPPDNLDTFGTFAGEVASRYAGQVDAYEIWFQPNNRLSWMTTDVSLRSDGFPDARLSSVRYIDLLEVAYDAIKTTDPDALVLTAGLAPTGNNDFYNSIDNFVFFEALLEQGASNFSDGFGVHVDGFSNAPDATCCGEPNQDPPYDESYHFFFADTLDNFREILDRNNGTDQPLWVTRFGWGTTDGASGDGSGLDFVALNTATDQADYTAVALAAGAERGDVGAMFLYNLNGCAVDNTHACYYSLINADGNARDVFSALAAFEVPTAED
ncbi:MAG: LysM peptidoglycan-binding domain-containing protein [Anaerolineae bacterium]